jgi:hypothetical protein
VNEFARIHPGLPVADIGHYAMGTIGAVSSRAFQLTRPDGSFVWLKPESLFSVDRAGAVLVCNHSSVDLYECVEDWDE